MTYSPKLGYACICDTLREHSIFTSRTVRLASVQSAQQLKDIALTNLRDLFEILQWNESMGIKFYRLSSAIFPHLHSPKLKTPYDLDFAKEALHNIGKFAAANNHRITAHPSQFVQLGSPRPEVVAQSIIDLQDQATIFDYMNLTNNEGTCMIVHGGGVFKDKLLTLERWATTYNGLPSSIKRYLVIENDDYHYTIDDLLPLTKRLNIPLCVDYFHHQLNPSANPSTNPLNQRFMATHVLPIWQANGKRAKVHVSTQQPGARKGAHADYIDTTTARFKQVLKVCSTIQADIMIEAKRKELAALDLLKQYYNETKQHHKLQWTYKH